MNHLKRCLVALSVPGLIQLAAARNDLLAQDARASAVIELNRALLESNILNHDATLLEEIALDQFVVIAPGGVVENKSQAMNGVNSFDAVGIALTEEHVSFAGSTAVLVGRLEIDGEMQPVGRLGPMRFMAVFVQTEEGWRLLARSLTPCFEMAIARGRC